MCRRGFTIGPGTMSLAADGSAPAIGVSAMWVGNVEVGNTAVGGMATGVMRARGMRAGTVGAGATGASADKGLCRLRKGRRPRHWVPNGRMRGMRHTGRAQSYCAADRIKALLRALDRAPTRLWQGLDRGQCSGAHPERRLRHKHRVNAAAFTGCLRARVSSVMTVLGGGGAALSTTRG